MTENEQKHGPLGGCKAEMFFRSGGTIAECGDEDAGVCPVCATNRNKQLDEVGKVLDDSGQMDGWPPYEGSLIAARVRAVVVCRDANGDSYEEERHARKQLEARCATLGARWKRLRQAYPSTLQTQHAGILDSIEAANPLPDEGTGDEGS